MLVRRGPATAPGRGRVEALRLGDRRPTPRCSAATRDSAPAELLAQQPRRPRATALAIAQLRRRHQPEPGAPQEHVGDRARLLAPGRDHDLGEQVRVARDDRLAPARGAPRRGRAPLAPRARSGRRAGRAAPSGSATLGLEVLGAGGHPERDVVGAALGLAAVALDDPVDDLRPPSAGRW